jgi:hypothetical protein
VDQNTSRHGKDSCLCIPSLVEPPTFDCRPDLSHSKRARLRIDEERLNSPRFWQAGILVLRLVVALVNHKRILVNKRKPFLVIIVKNT